MLLIQNICTYLKQCDCELFVYDYFSNPHINIQCLFCLRVQGYLILEIFMQSLANLSSSLHRENSHELAIRTKPPQIESRQTKGTPRTNALVK